MKDSFASVNQILKESYAENAKSTAIHYLVGMVGVVMRTITPSCAFAQKASLENIAKLVRQINTSGWKHLI